MSTILAPHIRFSVVSKEEILKRYFGYDSFRPMQAEVIDTVLSGRDALILMPTGGGKSVCYQVPALVREGLCVVVSPLIALMQDQVQNLRANGVPAAYINSSLSAVEIRKVELQCEHGELKMLYVSPEKVFAGGFLGFLRRLKINLFAIDESHCVSFWGHDFRPEYKQLHILREQFPNVPMLALTATADKVTRRDILQQLGIPDAEVFIASFDRPNLSLTVLPGLKRMEQIRAFLKRRAGQAGIIYCLSRRGTESVAEQLNKAGYKAAHYHAGMDANYRRQTQEAFIKDELQIIVATIAFGMGIDKSNVRWVIHYNLPKNVESYYQEIGRAGRDGQKSDTVLFYSFADYETQRQMNSELPEERRKLLDAKLLRMKQYAEADICRRRILLSYFNEVPEKDCGNCDVCHNPRSKFDGTVLAQKALSAIARTQEQIAMGMLIDILRGSMNRTVTEKEYHLIKTFGAGKDHRAEEWLDYLTQMLNLGLMEIAYDQAHALKLTPQSWEVLRGERKVQLVNFVSPLQKQAQAAEKAIPQQDSLTDELFERLRKLRKAIADEQNLPAYVVFTDATLTEIARQMPQSEESLADISGVSRKKCEQYGDEFLAEIAAFIREKGLTVADVPAPKKAKIPQVSTYEQTWELLQRGHSVEKIAELRGMSAVTVYSHIAKFYEDGKINDLSAYISAKDAVVIMQAAKQLGMKRGDALKPLFEHFEGQYGYHEIRLALAMWAKQ